MSRKLVWATKFKKEYKLAIKRRLDIDLLDDIIRALSRGEKSLKTSLLAFVYLTSSFSKEDGFGSIC